ncbi:hypothetical protein KGO95_04450 [Patescibacteria group bacterium]|nr:hypothetical protein [Patescibacteria group bacterium]
MKRQDKLPIDAEAITQKAWKKGEREQVKRTDHRLTKMGLGEEMLPLPQAALTPDQKEAITDPLELLIEKQEKGIDGKDPDRLH